MEATTKATTTRGAPVLSTRQTKELLRQPDKRTRLGSRDAALLAILTGTGARIGEVVRLRVQDVERGPNGALLLTLKTLKRKDGHRRAVALLLPFTGPVRKHLASATPRYWAFEGRHGEHLSVRAAQEAVMTHLCRVRPDLRLYDLRHTAITTLLRASGGDVWLAVNLAGHTDSRQIIRRYGHHLVKDALRTAEFMSEALKHTEGHAVGPGR